MNKPITNHQMAFMLQQLEQLLDRTDIIGYAAARNHRILSTEAAEFLTIQNQLIMDLGEPELDEDGNETGRIGIKVGTHEFEEFQKKLNALAPIESTPDIFQIPMKEAIGKISGRQLLELEWMFTEDVG